MYLLNPKPLAAEFRSNSVSQHERMKYYLAFVVMGSVVAELPSYLPAEPITGAVLARSLVMIVGGALGTWLTYCVNRRGDDREFIDRSICLGLPVVIRVGVVAACLLIIYSNLGAVFGGESFKQFDAQYEPWIMAVFITGVLVAFYQRLACHMAQCSSPRNVA